MSERTKVSCEEIGMMAVTSCSALMGIQSTSSFHQNTTPQLDGATNFEVPSIRINATPQAISQQPESVIYLPTKTANSSSSAEANIPTETVDTSAELKNPTAGPLVSTAGHNARLTFVSENAKVDGGHVTANPEYLGTHWVFAASDEISEDGVYFFKANDISNGGIGVSTSDELSKSGPYATKGLFFHGNVSNGNALILCGHQKLKPDSEIRMAIERTGPSHVISFLIDGKSVGENYKIDTPHFLRPCAAVSKDGTVCYSQTEGNLEEFKQTASEFSMNSEVLGKITCSVQDDQLTIRSQKGNTFAAKIKDGFCENFVSTKKHAEGEAEVSVLWTGGCKVTEHAGMIQLQNEDACIQFAKNHVPMTQRIIDSRFIAV